MKVTFVQWAGNFPDSEKVKSKKIKDGKEDWIVNPLPSWFSTGEAIEIPDEQFWSRIDELLSLNFYVMIRRLKTGTVVYTDDKRFTVR